MTKKELIESVSNATGQSLKQAGESMDAVLDAIKSALKMEKKVTIASFGSFSIVKRKAREGRNPRTGEKIQIAESKLPKFTPGKTMKEMFKKKD
jgi:DNA-binding protein HU-beta